MANFEPDDDKKFDFSGARKYINIGITAFLVIISSILFFFLIFKLKNITGFMGKLLGILQPILFGLVIAYVLNPMMQKIEKLIRRLFTGKRIGKMNLEKLSRGISVMITVIIAVVIVYFLIAMLIPGLITSITNLAFELPGKIDAALQKLWAYLGSDDKIASYINNMVQQATAYLEDWLSKDLINTLNSWVNIVAISLREVAGTAMNLVIGVIVSVYVLNSKEMFIGGLKKLTYALFRKKHANDLIDLVRQSDRIFGGFIIGKLIDSAIIGVLCFLGMSVFKMPYAVLISTIVGLTNIIPFFGPYIGAIPSALLILLTNTMQGVYFIIFIIVLQQIDGNIIGPKVLGSSTGLSAFWVMFAILLGGGLFGIIGMILGVPVLSLIFYVLGTITDKRLKINRLPLNSSEYVDIDEIHGNNITYISDRPEPEKTNKKISFHFKRKPKDSNKK